MRIVAQGSGGKVDPASLSSGNSAAAAQAVDQGIAGVQQQSIGRAAARRAQHAVAIIHHPPPLPSIQAP